MRDLNTTADVYTQTSPGEDRSAKLRRLRLSRELVKRSVHLVQSTQATYLGGQSIFGAFSCVGRREVFAVLYCLR